MDFKGPSFCATTPNAFSHRFVNERLTTATASRIIGILGIPDLASQIIRVVSRRPQLVPVPPRVLQHVEAIVSESRQHPSLCFVLPHTFVKMLLTFH